MLKTSATDFSCKKAFELSYALFRLAAIAKSRSFAEALETKATTLLDSVVSKDYETARATLKHIEYFMRLGTDTGMLHPRNSEVIIKEGSVLYAAIAGLPEPATLQELNFDRFFSKSPLQDKERISAKSAKVPAKLELQDEIIAGEELQVRPFEFAQAKSDVETDEVNPAKSAIRQSAIMDRLRQTLPAGRQGGNSPDGAEGCRFAELQELLPKVSERTLRYDLQSLIDRGLAERVGGGKHGFYRSKTEPLQTIELPGVSSRGYATEEEVKQ